ncbi:MAG: DUF423 domain-containing protein [Gammaproteobacteria bacterium]|nr:MAG: DUF423 domain-containing protein [Gammaproteobacteria bacterium]
MTQGRWFVTLGAVSGALAVIAGASGAHGLSDIIERDSLQVFRTASNYQLIHSLVLCLIGVWLDVPNGSASGRLWLRWAGWLVLIGIIGFSGSLYLLAFLGGGSGTGWVGPLTPIGGLCLIVGWLALARAATRK